MVYWKLKTIQNDLKSTRPNAVLLLATRCLYGGHISAQVHQIQFSTTLGYSMLLWGLGVGYISAQVNWIQQSVTLGHKMPLPGGTSELRSTRPNLVPLWATRCIYQGGTQSSGQLDTTEYQSLTTTGGVCLTKGQSDPRADQMSSWLDVVPLLATKCFYWGHVWPRVSLTKGLIKSQADLK